MLLSVFTRHSAGCKFSRDCACRRCNCPKRVGGQGSLWQWAAGYAADFCCLGEQTCRMAGDSIDEESKGHRVRISVEPVPTGWVSVPSRNMTCDDRHNFVSRFVIIMRSCATNFEIVLFSQFPMERRFSSKE